MSKHYFTNNEGNTLIKEFENLLEYNKGIDHLDAVVGFLRASGYFSLRPFLNNIKKARILIGINVDKYIASAANRGKLFYGAEEEVKRDYLAQLKKDVESSPYRKDIEEGMFQMVKDILDGKLEVRAHPSKSIHSKIYLLYPEGFNEHMLGAGLITGSSNLTGNGLGISENKQYEFNVLLQENDDVRGGMEEFERLWEEAANCEITAIDVDGTYVDTYLKRDVTPYEIYIKMLIEFFQGRLLDLDMENPFDMPEGYNRYEYQTDAVIEGYQKLIKYDGFILADVVGLGKTVIATMIAKKYLIENGYDKTKILVVYPPAVEQNWKTTFHDFGIDKYTRFVSNGSLNKVLDVDNYDYWQPEEYDLVLVDEAHKFRNHTATSFEALQEICKMPRIDDGGVPGLKKKVMLISATPMNNSPQDLYNELLLFQDPRCCTIDGVSNLTTFFSPLIAEFKKRMHDPNYDLAAFKRLAKKVRDNIIKPITVRRTRTDIESIPRYNKDINGFPKVAPPEKKTYEMNDHLADLFESAMVSLANKLTYARYQAIAFLYPEYSEGLYEKAEMIAMNLANIRKNNLVKRLESSFEAFIISLNRFASANQDMINMWDNDKIYIAPDLEISKMFDAGMSEEEIEEKINQKAEKNPKNAIFSRKAFDPRYIELLRKDQEVLDKMVADWASVTYKDDSKFDKFLDLIKHELFRKQKNPGQKLVVFSESFDTISYLARRIKESTGRNDVLVISADNRNKLFKTIRENFDANSKTQSDDFNIILTTDVLAEGVNLHRSNIIVNYDTPWNSTKLMQRIGRVNRIGSVSKNIFNYVFYPSRQGNRQIKLNQIALSKIQTFHTTFGEDNQVYSQNEIIDPNLEKLFDEALQQQNEERNLEMPFFEELRELWKNNRKEYNRIQRLSLRSRTGRLPKTIDGVTLSLDTLVFLKTNLRKCFYRVSDDSCEELSVYDALNYFKATPDEVKVERIEKHHEHVQKAVEKFFNKQSEEQISLETTPQNLGSLGSQVQSALQLLNSMLPEFQDTEIYEKVIQLRKLAERGVITKIAKRLQRMQKELKNGRLKRADAIEEIHRMATYYSPYYLADEELRREQETSAEIILSESFQ